MNTKIQNHIIFLTIFQFYTLPIHNYTTLALLHSYTLTYLLSPVAAAARSTTVAKFDHEMVLTSAGCNQTEVSSQPRPSPAGLNPAAAAIESVRGDGSKES